MLWSLVRLHESGNRAGGSPRACSQGWRCCRNSPRSCWLPAGDRVRAGAGLAAALAVQPWPFLAALIGGDRVSAGADWNTEHDWASSASSSCARRDPSIVAPHRRRIIVLQFGLVGFVLLPVVLSGVTLTAWRGYRNREPVAILLSTAVLVPFIYFLWKSLTLRVGDTCRCSCGPPALPRPPSSRDVVARRLAGLDRDNRHSGGRGWPSSPASVRGRRVLLLRRSALESDRKTDPVGGEAGYEQVARAHASSCNDRRDVDCDVGLSHLWMLRWHFNGEVRVIQINERGRFRDLAIPA